MDQAAHKAGTADRRSIFELFPRRLPEGRRYGVVAGVGRALDSFERFRFGDAELAVVRDGQVVDEATLDWLADFRFSGDRSEENTSEIPSLMRISYAVVRLKKKTMRTKDNTYKQ